ncbi:MAG: nucleotidyltransferase family protein [Pseudolysinimonas sp.]
MDPTLYDITGLRVPPEGTVRDTIDVMGANRRQIALVVDETDKLLGVVTDGDIRRGMLRGVTLEASVREIMNASPHVASRRDSTQSMVDLMNRHQIHHVPVLDAEGSVTGLFTIDDVVRPVEASTPIVLMAGGRGQRLYPLTKETPKPMLPIGGVPLLEIILRNLRAQGFVNVYISVNYLADVIIDYVGDGSQLGLHVRYVRETKPLGTAGALASLADEIVEPFVVMNSDLLTHVNLREMLSFHRKQGARGTVGVREHLFEIPYGVVNLEGSAVHSMVEKPMHRSLVNTGIYVLDPAALALLVPEEYADMPTLLGQLIDEGHSVAAFPIHESWLDVGRPEDLDRARSDAENWTDG